MFNITTHPATTESQAFGLPAEIEMQKFTAENGKDAFTVAIDKLLYIECADNYSTITYWDADVKRKIILRGSLKFFQQQIAFSQIVRCHRTFIVNLKNITVLEGNTQGYGLRVKYTSELLPVSRKHAPAVVQAYKQLRNLRVA
jgi:DNA-binding LytR/AlgR family response regulator